MELVERTDQTDRLERLLSLAADRQGQTVVLDGPAASGRTALLQHTAEQAARRGFLVLHATCAAAESGLQLGAITQLLHSAELPEDAAQQGVRLLHEAAAQREGGAPAPAPGQPQALHELCLLLFKIAAEAPTLIAVDDVQHADADSLQCLLALARRLRSAHGLLVLTDDAHRPARAVSAPSCAGCPTTTRSASRTCPPPAWLGCSPRSWGRRRPSVSVPSSTPPAAATSCCCAR